LLSILGALGGIAVIGLFLGLLAVERNTRVLGQLAERMVQEEAGPGTTDSTVESPITSTLAPADLGPSPGTAPDLQQN
jgi:Na+-transporting methylmalonyl-CoA/oxaloacetate decarboxylase gamma subunit